MCVCCVQQRRIYAMQSDVKRRCVLVRDLTHIALADPRLLSIVGRTGRGGGAGRGRKDQPEGGPLPAPPRPPPLLPAWRGAGAPPPHGASHPPCDLARRAQNCSLRDPVTRQKTIGACRMLLPHVPRAVVRCVLLRPSVCLRVNSIRRHPRVLCFCAAFFNTPPPVGAVLHASSHAHTHHA